MWLRVDFLTHMLYWDITIFKFAFKQSKRFLGRFKYQRATKFLVEYLHLKHHCVRSLSLHLSRRLHVAYYFLRIFQQHVWNIAIRAASLSIKHCDTKSPTRLPLLSFDLKAFLFVKNFWFCLLIRIVYWGRSHIFQILFEILHHFTYCVTSRPFLFKNAEHWFWKPFHVLTWAIEEQATMHGISEMFFCNERCVGGHIELSILS